MVGAWLLSGWPCHIIAGLPRQIVSEIAILQQSRAGVNDDYVAYGRSRTQQQPHCRE